MSGEPGDPDIDDKTPETPQGRSKGGASERAADAAERPTGLGIIRELLRTWGPAVLAVILIRTFIFEPYRIPSGSMVPTLLIGDHVLVSKFAYGIWIPWTRIELLDLGDPQRGDVIVFRYPRNPSLTYIKRVIGIPGDKIRVRDNRVILNGVEQPTTPTGSFAFVDDECRDIPSQEYQEDLSGVKHDILTSTTGGTFLADTREITVPPKNVFVMGDNRDHSEDSRRWGFVRYDQVKGKAYVVWFSWNSCSGGFGSIRGDRWFHSLYE